jgi:hypothetical protein
VLPGFTRSFGPGRIGGLFNNPNHLAAFLSMVMFLCAGWMWFGRAGAALRLFLGFVILAIATGTALTVSRGALLGVAVGAGFFMLMALWLVWHTQRALFKWLLLGGSLLLVLGGGVLYKVNEEAIERREMGSPISEDVRGRIWSSAMTQHAEEPLWGAGARMFYAGSIQFRDPRMANWEGDALFAHNDYLQMLADYGWAGLALLTVLIATHLWNGIVFVKWFARSKFPRTGRLGSVTLSLVLGSLAALTATMVHAVVEFHWHIPAVILTGAVMLGFLANPGIDADGPKRLRVPGVRVGIGDVGPGRLSGRAGLSGREAEGSGDGAGASAACGGNRFTQWRDSVSPGTRLPRQLESEKEPLRAKTPHRSRSGCVDPRLRFEPDEPSLPARESRCPRRRWQARRGFASHSSSDGTRSAARRASRGSRKAFSQPATV